MSTRTRGTLIIIGGGITEGTKEGSYGREIMEEMAVRAKKGRGCIGLVTAATSRPEETIASYTKDFRALGVERVEAIDIRSRDDACRKENVEKLTKCTVIFFTCGDQLRITSQIGDSPLFRCM